MDIVVPLSYLALIILLSNFIEPVSWRPPLVETCHCMQFSCFATRALSEQVVWFFSYFYYNLSDLTVDIDFMGGLKSTGQDAVMPDPGKTLG